MWQTESLAEKWRVTEWKNGCIYKTVSLGEHWIDSDTDYYKHNDKGEFYTPVSTKRMKELDFKTCRRKV